MSFFSFHHFAKSAEAYATFQNCAFARVVIYFFITQDLCLFNLQYFILKYMNEDLAKIKIPNTNVNLFVHDLSN